MRPERCAPEPRASPKSRANARMYVPLEQVIRITAPGSPSADVSATLMREDAEEALSQGQKRSSERPAEAVSDEGGLIGREPQGDNRGAEPTSNARVARDSRDSASSDGVDSLFEPTLF